MNRRGLWIVAVLTVLALGAASLALWSAAKPARITTNRLLFPDLAAKAGSIARIEIAGAGQPVVIERQDKGWVLPAKEYYPADGARIGQLIAALAHIAPLEEKTSDPARYADLGLGPPGKAPGSGKEIKLLDAHGNIIADAVIGRMAVNLGRVGGGIYVRRPDQAESWLSEGMIEVSEGALAWTRQNPFDLTAPTTIKTATVTAGGKTVVTASRNNPDDENFFITPAPPGKQDNGKALRLMTLPVSLSFDDVRVASPDDGAPARSATFQGFATDGPIYRIDVIGSGKDVWVKLGESGEGAGVKPFNEAHGKWLYKLAPYRSESLLAGIRDYTIKPETGKK